MKKVLLLVAAIIVVWLATAWATTADSGIPEGVEVFYVDGATCVMWKYDNANDLYDRVELECFCPCGGCYVQTEVAPTPTGRPGQTVTVVPTDPVETPTPQDTPTPVTPPPDPTEKPKANCGLGNREEGADPNENACGKKTGEENEPGGPPGKKDK